MAVAISIKNLKKSYKGTDAVKGISFDVKEGEFFGFLGPNGAGKSSTIHSITGICNFNEGSIEVFGHDVVKDYRAARAFIGLSPQEFNLDPFFSIFELMVFQGGYYGLEIKKAKERAAELLKKFGLWEKKDMTMRALSGGMKRRLTIAQALMHEPKILILDEPTAGVDIELRHELWNFLKELNEKGTTIVLTTHYIEEAEKLCDRICIMNKGKIIELDDKDKVMEKFGKSKIAIELAEPLKSIPEKLQAYNCIIKGNSIEFIEPKSKINGIIKAIDSLNIRIEDIDIKNDSLEDIFLELIRR
ncbi:ABC transporter ATP-binding protein [Candidatus Woesearchaeota archaeon]|nr:ABC transporter ATP-binding protein [Candidatus Woesearchaeota archaeon]